MKEYWGSALEKAIASGLALGFILLAIKLFGALFAWDARRVARKKTRHRS